MLLAAGCAASPREARDARPTTVASEQGGLTSPSVVPALNVVVSPPAGWMLDPLKRSGSHVHQVWKSPSGNTAYGVIHFGLPFAVGHELTLVGFLRNMKKSEGEAILVEKARDPRTGGIAFVADGGAYRVRTVLNVRGRRGWAVYAGTLRDRPIDPDELELALRAREHTTVGGRDR